MKIELGRSHRKLRPGKACQDKELVGLSLDNGNAKEMSIDLFLPYWRAREQYRANRFARKPVFPDSLDEGYERNTQAVATFKMKVLDLSIAEHTSDDMNTRENKMNGG